MVFLAANIANDDPIEMIAHHRRTDAGVTSAKGQYCQVLPQSVNTRIIDDEDDLVDSYDHDCPTNSLCRALNNRLLASLSSRREYIIIEVPVPQTVEDALATSLPATSSFSTSSTMQCPAADGSGAHRSFRHSPTSWPATSCLSTSSAMQCPAADGSGPHQSFRHPPTCSTSLTVSSCRCCSRRSTLPGCSTWWWRCSCILLCLQCLQLLWSVSIQCSLWHLSEVKPATLQHVRKVELEDFSTKKGTTSVVDVTVPCSDAEVVIEFVELPDFHAGGNLVRDLYIGTQSELSLANMHSEHVSMVFVSSQPTVVILGLRHPTKVAGPFMDHMPLNDTTEWIVPAFAIAYYAAVFALGCLCRCTVEQIIDVPVPLHAEDVGELSPDSGLSETLHDGAELAVASCATHTRPCPTC